jgi:hypothetical protein
MYFFLGRLACINPIPLPPPMEQLDLVPAGTGGDSNSNNSTTVSNSTTTTNNPQPTIKNNNQTSTSNNSTRKVAFGATKRYKSLERPHKYRFLARHTPKATRLGQKQVELKDWV